MNSDGGERPGALRLAAPQRGGPGGVQCVRCGHPVPDLVMGCKHPCRNCRYLYPAGDCSD